MTLHGSGYVGLASSAALLAIASVVFFTGPSRTVNRRLALLLFVAAAELVTGTWSLAPFIEDPGTMYGVYAVHMTAGTALPFLYFAFLGHAFDSAVTRVLRRRGTTLALWGGALLSAALFLAFLPKFLPAGDWTIGSPLWQTFPPSDSWFAPWTSYVALSFLATFAIALHALLTTRHADRRRRLKAYVLAFGVWDLSMVLNFFAFSGILFGPRTATVIQITGPAVYATAPLVFSVVLAYGILRTQLFDIDLRLKWTLSHGTVAAVFLGVFFVVATITSEFLTGRYGFALGGAAAGMLLFALAPLQRFAERLSDRAMPRVQDTAEYRTVRKREVYRATVEGAMQDGVVSDRERDMLARLQDQLGLSGTEAREIEQEASMAASGRAANAGVA